MVKREFLRPKSILFFFIALNLVIGAFIAPDFSRCTDEAPEQRRSSFALDMYTSGVEDLPFAQMKDLGLTQYYGTAITSFIRAVERYGFPDIDHGPKVVAHYLYFAWFQIAVVCIYFLANNFFRNEWYSLFTAFLFGTQPILVGHAFVNPKDIPIMAIFLATIVLGFKMVDQLQNAEAQIVLDAAGESDKRSSEKERTRQEKIFIFLFLFIFIFIWSGGFLVSLALDVIQMGYQAQGVGLIGKLFVSLTTSGSLEGYKLLGFYKVFSILRWIYLVIPVGLLLLFLFARNRKLFYQNIDLWVFFAAAVWGIAVSTRIIAVAAGGIVGLYAFLKLRQRAFFPLVIYSLTAMMISFVTWPFLWMEGFAGYFKSLTLISDYPWAGYVLFNGSTYLPKELPASYVPKMMSLGFTEPLVILAVAGFVIALYMLYKNQTDRARMGVVVLWFLLPIIYIASFHPTVYDGFRQFFFIVPPLFIFSGLAFQFLAKQLKKRHWVVLTALILLIPGIVGLIRLHPYQMMYFNAFTGGIKGAEGRFHIPFLNSGYKEAMEFINETVPSESKLLFWKEDLFGRVYAENSYEFGSFYPGDDLSGSDYDYIVVPASSLQQMEFSQYPVYYTVIVDEVPIVYVFELVDP